MSGKRDKSVGGSGSFKQLHSAQQLQPKPKLTQKVWAKVMQDGAKSHSISKRGGVIRDPHALVSFRHVLAPFEQIGRRPSVLLLGQSSLPLIDAGFSLFLLLFLLLLPLPLFFFLLFFLLNPLVFDLLQTRLLRLGNAGRRRAARTSRRHTSVRGAAEAPQIVKNIRYFVGGAVVAARRSYRRRRRFVRLLGVVGLPFGFDVRPLGRRRGHFDDRTGLRWRHVGNVVERRFGGFIILS